MSSIDLEFLIGWLIPWIIAFGAFVLAVVWAVNLRRGMTVRVRRRQELGIALVSASVAWFIFNIIFLYSPSLTGTIGDLEFFFEVPLLALILFYWADSSLLASRRSDPLLRDTLRWSRIRKGFWLYIIVDNSLFIAIRIIYYDILLGNPPLSPGPNSLIGFLADGAIVLPFVVAPILLAVAWLRARDPTIRIHLKWFAYCVISLGLSVVVLFVTGFFTIWPLGWAFAGYCLFRSAGSLVVVSELPLEELRVADAPTSGAL